MFSQVFVCPRGLGSWVTCHRSHDQPGGLPPGVSAFMEGCLGGGRGFSPGVSASMGAGQTPLVLPLRGSASMGVGQTPLVLPLRVSASMGVGQTPLVLPLRGSASMGVGQTPLVLPLRGSASMGVGQTPLVLPLRGSASMGVGQTSNPCYTRDTMENVQQPGGTQPTGMLSCYTAGLKFPDFSRTGIDFIRFPEIFYSKTGQSEIIRDHVGQLILMAYLHCRTWTRIPVRVRISVPKMGTVMIRDLD